MMRTWVFAMVVLCALGGCTKRPQGLKADVLLPFTPVKSQDTTQVCWAYAMLSTIETEHIVRGDSVHLSVPFVYRAMEQDTEAPSSKRGMGITAVNLIQRHGLVPYDAMRSIDTPRPRLAFMYGVEYTLQEFARSVCAPDEYIGLMSDDDEPYGEMVVPQWKDNWEQNALLNMPMDSLLVIAERAINTGHGVCWEGDISECGFNWQEGYAVDSWWNGRTTDDHCMAIVGLGHDDAGEHYFIMKNSWGTKNPYEGLMFLSYGYFMKKTVAVFLNKDLICSDAR